MIRNVVLTITLALSLGLFVLPTDLHIEQSVEIEADPAEVWPHLVDLGRWNDWDPWQLGTTGTNRTGVGATRDWPGAGQLTISEVEPMEVIRYTISGLGTPAEGELLIEATENGLLLTWSHYSWTEFGPIARLAGWQARGETSLKMVEGLERIEAIVTR